MTKRQMFKELRDKAYTLLKISLIIGVSLKTAKRMNKEYKEGTLIREHGLVGKVGNRKVTVNKKKVLEEYLESQSLLTHDGKAEPYNFSYFCKYKLKEPCSLSTFYLIMEENLIASPWANKATKKANNKLLKAKLKNKNISKKEKKQIKEIIKWNEKTYFRKARPEYAGEIGEIDACKDYWLGDTQSHLYACYDPATKRINAIHIEKEETTHGYYIILKMLIEKGLIPETFKSDCRSVFIINKRDAGALAHKDVNTQFGFVLNLLEVGMENSSEPTFKGGVERVFRTIQNQLKGEFRERGITTFEKANEYLKEYMEQYNKQYAIKAAKKETKFKKITLSDKKINELLSIRTFKKIDKANSFSFKSELWSLYDENKNRLSFKEKSAILILETLNGEVIAKYYGETMVMKKTDYKYFTGSQKEQYKNLRRITPSFTAPDNHPWGYKMFMLYLHNTNNLKRYLKK